jgi:hypothetical protein
MDRTLVTKRISQRTFVLLTKNKLVSSDAIISSWKKFVPSCTCHIVNIGECKLPPWALHTIVNHHNMEMMTIIIVNLNFTNSHFQRLSLKLTSLTLTTCIKDVLNATPNSCYGHSNHPQTLLEICPCKPQRLLSWSLKRYLWHCPPKWHDNPIKQFGFSD